MENFPFCLASRGTLITPGNILPYITWQGKNRPFLLVEEIAGEDQEGYY